MTLKEKRIVILEACGWKKANPISWYVPDGSGSHLPIKLLPDPFNDLNACHEMEEWLDNNERVEFGCHLARLGQAYHCTPNDESIYVNWEATHAPPAQRWEAFLRTKKKWQEDKP